MEGQPHLLWTLLSLAPTLFLWPRRRKGRKECPTHQQPFTDFIFLYWSLNLLPSSLGTFWSGTWWFQTELRAAHMDLMDRLFTRRELSSCPFLAHDIDLLFKGSQVSIMSPKQISDFLHRKECTATLTVSKQAKIYYIEKSVFMNWHWVLQLQTIAQLTRGDYGHPPKVKS